MLAWVWIFGDGMDGPNFTAYIVSIMILLPANFSRKFMFTIQFEPK